jgi:hypothetical protein
MRVTTVITWDVETGEVIEHEFYEWCGSVDKLCSSGDSTASALEKSQAAMTTTLNNDYNTTFAEQQSVLASQTAKLNYIAANPMGYTPQELATQTTAINENTATAAKQAMGAAAAFAGSHGGADVGNGAVGEIAGQIGSQEAQSKAGELASLSQQNQQMKQNNMWSAIQGLNQVGAEYGGSSGTAIGASSNVAESSVDAGKLNLATEQAGWSDIGGMMSGIAGLGTAAAGFDEGGSAPASLSEQLNEQTLGNEMAPGGPMNDFSG